MKYYVTIADTFNNNLGYPYNKWCTFEGTYDNRQDAEKRANGWNRKHADGYSHAYVSTTDYGPSRAFRN